MIFIELAAVILMAIAGARIAARLSRARWVWGALAPASILVLIFITHRVAWLPVYAPFSWLTDTSIEPPLMACAIVLLFSTIISALRVERTRILAASLSAVLVTYHSVLPLAIPLALRPAFARMTTRVNSEGVCLQTQSYTCGPAAAVTSLRGLGILADEADLTIESRCQPPLGVDAQALAGAINRLYGSEGVTAECHLVPSIDELPVHAIASLLKPNGKGHAVSVLDVTRDTVVVGDPAGGIWRMPRPTFFKWWTGVAVIVTRE